MLDIRVIRENPTWVIENLKKRNKDFTDEINELLDIDKSRREISAKTDSLKAKQNKTSREIPKLKKAGEDVADILEEMKELSDKIKKNDDVIKELNEKQVDLLLNIPNIPDESVPMGVDDSDNELIKTWGEPRKFDFDPLPHWDLGENLGLLDPERAAKVTGSRFHFILGGVARLQRAVTQFFLNTHVDSHGYTEIFPPYLVNRDSMTGTGQLPKFEDDAFKLIDPDYFLIPTAEVPVTNYYRDEILKNEDMPIRYTAYSESFRKEVGSAGRDTRGIIRQHQFSKVELVKFTNDTDSNAEHEMLTENAEALLEALELPYRRMNLCGGDLGFSNAKTYDLEVWMPSYNRYVEISSCSNYKDYQARRAKIRYREEEGSPVKHVHTLNGSGLAVGRTVAAIMENCQNKDGTITIPKVLVPYMGTDIIK